MTNQGSYKPISCVFYDYLEADATLGVVSDIEYNGSDGNSERIKAKIKDLIIKNKIEFMVLDNDQVIRLDSILKFNGISALDPCST